MITHESKLKQKDIDEGKNEYQFNVSKRDQVEKQVRNLVDCNDNLNKELTLLVDTDD